jgi:hypothetical protein
MYVLPPHPVKSMEKRKLFETMYRRGVRLPPIVVVRRGLDDWAISGSHRSAALALVKPGEPVVTGEYFLVVEGADLLRGAYARKDAELIELLNMLFQGDLGEEPDGYHRLVDAVLPHVGEREQRALEGQGTRR